MRFAEQFSLHPEDVERTSLRTWTRWLLLEQARASKLAFERMGTDAARPEDRELIRWAMIDEA